MMQIKYIKLKQDNIILYLFKLGVLDIINNSIIERFDSSEDTGYQRQPIPAHYKKISKYFMETNPAILPTAILAAINPNNILEHNEDVLEINDKIRIVDGQHRIKGLEELKAGYTSTSIERFNVLKDNYEFPVVLMVLEPNTDKGVSVLEVDAFININNKGKKVNTNLAKQLKEQNYRRSQLNINDVVVVNDDLISNSSTRIVMKISEKKDSMWFNNIILGDAIDNKKPISINAFSKAIKPIVSQCITKIQVNEKIEKENLYEEELSLLDFLDNAWNTVIDKWSSCFTDDRKYHINYNICKGIGVFPLYGLLTDCLLECNADKSSALICFKKYLDLTNIVSYDWLVGGRFTGMTSGQAIKQVVKILKNQ